MIRDIIAIQDIIEIPLCSQAIENCKHGDWPWWEYVRNVLDDNNSFERAITMMFNWAETPQGDEYWRMLYERNEMPQGLCDWN